MQQRHVENAEWEQNGRKLTTTLKFEICQRWEHDTNCNNETLETRGGEQGRKTQTKQKRILKTASGEQSARNATAQL